MTAGDTARAIGGLAAALLLAGTVSAQGVAPFVGLKETVRPAADEDIVVTAKQKATAEQVEKQAQSITRMEDFYTSPLARFDDVVCPGVAGLGVDVASLLVDRIRYDAERVGIKVDKADKCRPNIVVAFVLDGRAAVKELLRTSGYMFSRMTTAEAKEIEDETGPVRAWHNTVLKDRYGRAVSGDPSGANPVGNAVGEPYQQVTTPMGDSHVFLATRLDIASAMVVIDVKAIDGLTVDQIADYVAMRVFAKTRPVNGDAAASTILSLFDRSGGRAPDEMTSFDLAYLRSLYRAEGNLPASAKIAGVSTQLRKAEQAEASRTSAQKR